MVVKSSLTSYCAILAVVACFGTASGATDANFLKPATLDLVKLQGSNPYDMLLLKLSTHYDDAALAKMLVAAKQDGKTSGVAGMLEEVQFKSWQSGGKSADAVFKLLELNKEGDNLFSSPMMASWKSYLATLNKSNPDELMQLKKYYDEDGLTSLIAKAKGSTSAKSIAVKLQEEIWRSQGKTADDVFKLLQLSKSGNTFLKLRSWPRGSST